MKIMELILLAAMLVFSLSNKAMFDINTNDLPDSKNFVKTHYSNKLYIGGECNIIESWYTEDTLSIPGKIIIMQHFKVEIPENGKYYLSAWAMGMAEQGEIISFSTYVDGNEMTLDELNFSGVGWQSVKFMDKAGKSNKNVFLVKGEHKISFGSFAPFVPQIEFLRMSKSKDESLISKENYDEYIKSIQIDIENEKENEKTIKDTSKLKSTLPNPEGNYFHQVNINFNYTYYKKFYFQQNQNVRFYTSGSIQTYYRRSSSLKTTYSFEESVALGLTILPEIYISNEESNKIEN